jgi:hypothetical protein
MSKQFDKHEHLKHVPPGTQFDDTEPRSGRIFAGAIIVGVFLVATIQAVNSYYTWFRDKTLYERQLSQSSVELGAIRAQEDHALNNYGFVEKDKAIVRLPIARAIDLVIAEASEGKERYPVAAKIIPPPQTDAAPGATPAAAGNAAAGNAPAAATPTPTARPEAPKEKH